jgi:hypothetical protein
MMINATPFQPLK